MKNAITVVMAPTLPLLAKREKFGVAVPPVGIILVLGYFLNKEKYQDVEVSETVNWFAVIGVVLGAVVANLVHWGIASINGMVVAAVCYLIGRAVEKK